MKATKPSPSPASSDATHASDATPATTTPTTDARPAAPATTPTPATDAPATTPAAPPFALTPQNAWLPLPASEWNAAAARHLLRRAAWSAQPEDVKRAVADGLQATLERLFPERTTPFPLPASITKLIQDAPSFAARQRAAANADEKRALQRERRGREQDAEMDMTVRWLQFASSPELSAQEKWTLFLSDVYVVAFDKVRNPAHIHYHHALIRALGLGPAPTLVKAISRSPAMIRYLDLQDSKKDAPNENFARELFELFTLGEGNYTEQDIKQAARAFTGYRVASGQGYTPVKTKTGGRYGTAQFVFDPRQHDTGPKTVFGQTGNFNGDDIIDLVYKQRAASAFIPHEMTRFYLTDAPFPPEYLNSLGDWWAAKNHNLRALAHRFFGSRLFHSPAFAGNYIKSPIQLYLGLLQDLRLDVAPTPRQTVYPLRQMGQMPFQPPNVRGWVGGRNWINSATLAARRQLVQNLFTPINAKKLNADEQAALNADGPGALARYSVAPALFMPLARAPAHEVADEFLRSLLPGGQPPAYRAEIIKYIAGENKPAYRIMRVRDTAITLLQSPEYQLC